MFSIASNVVQILLDANHRTKVVPLSDVIDLQGFIISVGVLLLNQTPWQGAKLDPTVASFHEWTMKQVGA